MLLACALYHSTYCASCTVVSRSHAEPCIRVLRVRCGERPSPSQASATGAAPRATPCPCPPSFARARPRTALLVRDGATRKLREHCRRNLVCQHRYTHATRPRRCGPPRRRALLYARGSILCTRGRTRCFWAARCTVRRRRVTWRRQSGRVDAPHVLA